MSNASHEFVSDEEPSSPTLGFENALSTSVFVIITSILLVTIAYFLYRGKCGFRKRYENTTNHDALN